MALPLDLAQDVDPVVVAQGPGHLVVVHRQVVLLDPPQPGQPGWVDNLEDARLLVLPLDVAGVPLRPVVQQLLQKVPQQATIRGGGVQVLTFTR